MQPVQAPFWQRAYRRLLRFFPADFRWDYGGEMEDMFAQQYATALHQGGRMTTARLWWKTAQEILMTAPGEYLEMLRLDTRYALRLMRKSPLFTLIAILTLALGVGSLTSAFTLLNAFFLRPLPFAEPDQLVHIWQTDSKQGQDQLRVSVPNYEDWQRESTSFEEIAGYFYRSKALGREFASANLISGELTTNMFGLLGVEPILGRTFSEEEGVSGRDQVVVLSEGFWRRYLDADPAALGRALHLDDVPYQVIGVMPGSFVFPFPKTELWTPISPAQFRDDRADNGPLLVVGRLREGLARDHAQQEFETVMNRLVQSHPKDNANKGVNLVDLRQALLFNYDMFRVTSIALLAAAGFIVLIVCANLGNLQLARAASRKQEVAIRAAVGAGSTRLLRQLLTESSLLAILGGALGVGLAQLIARGADRVLPLELYRVGEIAVDGVTLGFALLACLGAALVFGLAPALRVTRHDLVSSLKAGDRRGGVGRQEQRLRSLLVVSQVAMATLLVAGAALMLQTLQRLQNVDTGFNPLNLATLEVRLPEKKYPTGSQQNLFFEDLLTRVRAYPGVSRAAMMNPIPLNFESYGVSFTLVGEPIETGETLFSNYFRVTTDFLETTEISLVRGRSFQLRDTPDTRSVGLVNRMWVEQFSPAKDPIGRLFRITSGEAEQEVEIVGLVEDSKVFDLSEDRTAAVYLSQNQASHRRRFLLVRTAGDPQQILAPMQNLIQEKDQDVPVTEARTMEDLIVQSLGPWMGGVAGLTFLGAGAILLAAIGLYGVVSYGVGQRKHEFGVRIALGAPRPHILGLVLVRALRLTGYGIVIGMVGSFVMTRALSALLFGVGSLDPITFLGTPVILTLVAVLASLLPAREAISVDPISALRIE